MGIARLFAVPISLAAGGAARYLGFVPWYRSTLVEVVNEILDYAKWEAHEIVLNQQSLDVGCEIHDAVVLLEGRAAQHGIQLRCLPAPALPPVWADRTRLRQVLLDLLSNALKFTPRGGRVTTDVAKAHNGEVEFRVRDTGIGISAEDLPRVLQPFSQATGGTATKRGGTGLGLPLAKGLVDLHGGSLTISSSPGAGTTVTVRLPASDQRANSGASCVDASLAATVPGIFP